MLWKKELFIFLLLHVLSFATGKHRIRKRDDASADPLLAEIFKSPETHAEPKEEHRPDRALDPGEELEAILTGFKNKNQHLFPVDGPIKRESGPEPGTNGIDQQNLMLNVFNQNPVTRENIPRPNDNANLMQLPNEVNVAASPDVNQNLMQLPEQQTPLNLNPDSSFMPTLQNNKDNKKEHNFQVKNFIPGRPLQQQNDWANQPGVTVYLHQDKKSSIPIPVKTGSEAVQSKGSFPLQMRRISPNMNIGSVVPHQAEYGETVESLFKKPEEIIAKKSEIPHADASKKADVAKVETVTKNETVSPEAAKEGDSAKKDFLQQPFMMLQQQQAAFQTMSQFGADQGNQNAAFAQSAPAMASAPALPAAPSMVAAPAVMSQPAAAMAPSSLPGEPCTDQYETCGDFAKNDYCTKYPVQMSTQCRKSCKFCVVPEIKQQIATTPQGTSNAAPQGASATANQFSAQGTQPKEVTQPGKGAPVLLNSGQEESGSGSGDSSGSGESPEGLALKKSNTKQVKVSTMFLPELGSGSESGSGSGDSFASGSEAAVVRQLASAQNIVSGLGQVSETPSKVVNNTKKSFMPVMRNVLKPRLTLSSAIVKKNNIPQRPVSPLKAMDVENVNENDDDDDASASGSGSGSGEEVATNEIVAKAKISKVASKKENVEKKPKATKKSEISKKSEITSKPEPAAPQISAYPRIDLRKIASALANYEEAALTLAGEYPRITAQETDVVTRSNIPHPPGLASPFNKLKQNIQIAKLVTQNNNKRFEIPKYLLVGDQITEKEGLAKVSSLPEADSLESVTQRFAIPGKKPNLQEYYAETGKPMYESDAAKRMRIARKKKKIQKPVDPFEYLRNMQAGASMEPIVDPHSFSSTRQSVSYPVYLMKVMPGSHKYVPASTRSKVNPIPKKPEVKANAPAVLAAADKKTTMTENANAKSEFDLGPGPELDSEMKPAAPEEAAPMEIELGPPKEQSAVTETEQPSALNAEAVHENFENTNGGQPALRTKMLSAFFNKKNMEEAEGSGFDAGSKKSALEGSGGDGNFINARDFIFGEHGV